MSLQSDLGVLEHMPNLSVALARPVADLVRCITVYSPLQRLPNAFDIVRMHLFEPPLERHGGRRFDLEDTEHLLRPRERPLLGEMNPVA